MGGRPELAEMQGIGAVGRGWAFLCQTLASRKAAAVLLIGLGLAILGQLYFYEGEGIVASLLALLFLSTLLCLWRGRRLFWRKKGMLVFHLALPAFVLLALISRMCYLKGYIEVAEGQGILGNFVTLSMGPWHDLVLVRVIIAQEGLEVLYLGPKGKRIESHLRFIDGEEEEMGVVTFTAPFFYRGYRFYAPGRMGYALLLRFTSGKGKGMKWGFVNLPDYPGGRARQVKSLHLPGAEKKVTINLELLEGPYREREKWTFDLPQSYRVGLTYDGKSHLLGKGEGMEVEEGTLVVEDLRRWMGYTVFYDPAVTGWLVAALVAVGSLVAHYLPLLWKGVGPL